MPDFRVTLSSKWQILTTSNTIFRNDVPSEPCFRETLPTVCRIYSFSVIAVAAAETLNSSPAGVSDGCERRAFRNTEDLVHSLGSNVSVILKETFDVVELVWTGNANEPQILDTFLDVLSPVSSWLWRCSVQGRLTGVSSLLPLLSVACCKMSPLSAPSV